MSLKPALKNQNCGNSLNCTKYLLTMKEAERTIDNRYCPMAMQPICLIAFIRQNFNHLRGSVCALKDTMPKEKIATDKAPAAIGPYSQAIRTGNLLFVSGQIPIDPATGRLVEGDIQAQTEQILKNITQILACKGCSLADVVKTTVFLTDINQFSRVNETYKKHFPEPCPARSCVEISRLPLDAAIEIEVIAACS